ASRAGTLPGDSSPYHAARSAGRARTCGPGRGARGSGRDLAGAGDVPVHLLDEGVDRVELQHVADAGGEVDGHVLAVEVEVVAVQRVRLDGPRHALERRVGADGDRGRPAEARIAVGVADQPAGVDAVGGDRGL